MVATIVTAAGEGIDYTIARTNGGAFIQTLDANKPSGVSDNDLLVAVVGFQSSAPTTPPVVTAPTGWVAATPAATTLNQHRGYQIWVKPIPTASAETSTSYTFSTSAGAGRAIITIMRVTGADLANPVLNQMPITYVSSSSATYTITGTTASDAGLAIWSAMTQNSANTGFPVGTWGAGVTDLFGDLRDFTNSAAANTGMHVGYERVSAGATGNRTISYTSINPTNLEGIACIIKDGAAAPPQSATVTPNSLSLGFASGTPWVYNNNAVDNWLMNRPFYCAHRGGSDDFPEMSMKSYDNSVAWGTPAIEVSMWRSLDGYWVASHDKSTLRVTGVDKDITATNWIGNLNNMLDKDGEPLTLATDVIAKYGQQVVVFVDNKQGTNLTLFFDMLDTYPNSKQRFVSKSYFTATNIAIVAHQRGYRTWGYFYDDAPSLAALTEDGQKYWDIIGMDYTASAAAWAQATQFKPKPIMAHILPTAASKTTADTRGANGYMVSGVTKVVPQANTSYSPHKKNGALASVRKKNSVDFLFRRIMKKS